MDLVLSRSFICYCILFWGPSTFSRAFLAFIKTGGFSPFSQFYEILHIVLGPSTVSRAFLAVVKTRGFDPFSPFYKLLHTVLGSVDSFEGISGSHENRSEERRVGKECRL